MITILAYNLLSTIACGEVTVHTLHLGILARAHSKEVADEILLNGLLELCDRGLITWRYHPCYGDKSPDDKVESSAPVFLYTWYRIFGFFGPRGEESSSSTISVEISKNAEKELQSEICEIYAGFVANWYS